MAIGGIIVGVTLKLMGAGQMTAGLEEVDIASRRAALSPASASLLLGLAWLPAVKLTCTVEGNTNGSRSYGPSERV